MLLIKFFIYLIKKHMTKIEYIAKYGEDAYKKHLEYSKQHYQNNKEKRIEQMKQWYFDNKDEKLEYTKQYYNDNKEKHSKSVKQWIQTNKDKNLENQKKYRNETQKGRAIFLLKGYKRSDKKANRGECTLTTDWIVNNIFTSKCVFCGESDWHKLGCDRIDNSLPHTPDNVQCCCGECNVKKHTYTNEEYINKITN